MFCYSNGRKYQDKFQTSYKTHSTNPYEYIVDKLKVGDNSQVPPKVKEVIQ